MATENTLWLPPLSPKDQEKLNYDQHNQRKAIIKETGFSGKTLWDYLNLSAALAIPLVVVLATIGFGLWQAQLADKQHINDLKIANDNRQNDIQLANDQQQEATLKTYLDDMTTLLLDKKLGSQNPADKAASAEAAIVARAKTLIALRHLNAQRKATIVQFLYEAHLIGYCNPYPAESCLKPVGSIIGLTGADLSGADLRFFELYGADLGDATLSHADLTDATLRGANLSFADLTDANLSFADLTDADLSEVVLRGANLTDAVVTQKQLAHALSLKGATMPDGSKHP